MTTDTLQRAAQVMLLTAARDVAAERGLMLHFVSPVRARLGEQERGQPGNAGQFGPGGGGESDDKVAGAHEYHGYQHTVEEVSKADARAVTDEVRGMRQEIRDSGMTLSERDNTGYSFTMSALDVHAAYGERGSALVSRDEFGDVGGAISLVDLSDRTDVPDQLEVQDLQEATAGFGSPAVFVDYLGSTHMSPGAGTALVREAAIRAASQGAALVGGPTADALGFWEGQIGWHPDPTGFDEYYGFTAAETKEYAETGTVKR